LLAIRYARRAVSECNGSIMQLPDSLRAQMNVAEQTMFCSMRLSRCCNCTYSLPLDPVHCVPCELRLQLLRASVTPESHTTEQQLKLIDEIHVQLTASGYTDC
jgi:hypothetical protein